MKKKLTRIMGVGVTIALLTSLAVVAAPASAADPLVWAGELGMPSTSATKNHLVSGSDVSDIAVGSDGTTIWAVSTASNQTFKSTDGGLKWLRKTPAFATAPQLVAIAPDDPDIVAIVGDNNKVYATVNGGTTFSLLTQTLTIDTIHDIAISQASSGVNYVGVAGDNNSATCEVGYFNLGSSVPAWTSALTGSTWSTTSFAGTTFAKAIAFSPNFASDKVMVVVTEAGTAAKLEIASFSSKKWNTNGGFASYPATVLSSTGGDIDKASLVLAPTYLGADTTERLSFVGIDCSTGNSTLAGTLKRYSDYSAKELKAQTAIHSVDYDGTNLVAGEANTNVVRRSANPLATTPTVSATSTYQRPGGASAVVVAWANENVVAGTTGVASAFALSKDNGKTFNDISLMDTAITNINDVAVTPDGSKIYMVTDNNTDLSVWRKASAWERVLSLTGETGHIIRIAPDDAAHVYVTNTGGSNMYYTNDSGETKWMLRALPSTSIVDVAVESTEVAYALTGTGSVYKTVNAGFIWASAKSTGLGGGATIYSIAEDALIVGSDDGYVAYSKDGNASSTTWKRPGISVGSGSVQVVATGLETDGVITAVDGTAGATPKRWKIDTNLTSWTTAGGALTGACTGLALGDGVLYMLADNSTDSESRIYRTLYPTSATSSAYWSSVATTNSANFNKTPQALKVSTGSNKIWAIDNAATDSVDGIVDSTFNAGPTLNSPATGFTVIVNPVTGKSYDVIFSWARLSKSTAYKLEISYDTGFKEDVTTVTKSSSSSTVVVPVGPGQTAGVQQIQFQPGTLYYWRVGATTPLFSPKSETRSFTIEEIVSFGISEPAIGGADVSTMPTFTWAEYEGAIGYEIMVSEDPTFTIIDWSHTTTNPWYQTSADEALAYSTTYYWRARGVTGVAEARQPAPGGPWAEGIFTTMAEPVEEEPIVITIPEPAPPAPAPEIVKVEVPGPAQAIPSYLLWAVIGIGAILIIALIILIVRTRRVA